MHEYEELFSKEHLKGVERSYFTNQSCLPQRQEQRAKFVTKGY